MRKGRIKLRSSKVEDEVPSYPKVGKMYGGSGGSGIIEDR